MYQRAENDVIHMLLDSINEPVNLFRNLSTVKSEQAAVRPTFNLKCAISCKCFRFRKPLNSLIHQAPST